MSPSDRIYLVALSKFAKFGVKSLLKLKRAFSNLEEAFGATFSELKRAGIDESAAREFIEKRREINPEKEWRILEKEGIGVIVPEDGNYPFLLKEIYDPPALLYFKGNMDDGGGKIPLAVVGTRQITAYGRQAVLEIISPLARAGITIVSGLALGIDALAHETAISQKGRTIAVLGSGLDHGHIYPSRNRLLAQKIVESGGAVISEFPTGTLPLRHHFPFRNRIISGLSLGTLVVEAADDSGSLITARCALEQNRDVFSVPGPFFSHFSSGPNNLLKMGAKAVTAAQDVFDALNLERPADIGPARAPETVEEKAVFDVLGREPMHIDEIIKKTGISSSDASAVLALMEMKNTVRNLGGMRYVMLG